MFITLEVVFVGMLGRILEGVGVGWHSERMISRLETDMIICTKSD
jgi:hypothetical protein